ncbi:MAG: hypothetical protein FD126_235 [Elusimicrobia bacterium]|nr:MAG: hypothetical protein FD126_235 [Elusimicrobiota bacterium]
MASPTAVLLQYAQASLWACTVCFGANDNGQLSKAFYFGGVILLTCTFGLVGGLVYAIVRMEGARTARDRAAGLYADETAG